MPDKTAWMPRPHTELRRQDQRAAVDQTEEAEVSKLKPRSPGDTLPDGDEDDLFNDMPV